MTEILVANLATEIVIDVCDFKLATDLETDLVIDTTTEKSVYI